MVSRAGQRSDRPQQEVARDHGCLTHKGERRMGPRAAVILVLAALAGVGLGAQQQPSANARDISGFWPLSFDGRKVPPAKLLPRVTKAMLDLHARQDVHAIRWCNPIGFRSLLGCGAAMISHGHAPRL